MTSKKEYKKDLRKNNEILGGINRGRVKLLRGRDKLEHPPHLLVNKNNGKDQSQVFYADGDAGFTAFGKKAGYFKGATGPTSVAEAKVFGETGLASVTTEGEYGKIGAKAVGASGEASLSISKVPEASLYGKAYLAGVSSSGYIPLPFTNHKIEVGFEADVVSIGGGVVISPKDWRAKVGAHFGIGADLIIGLK